MKIRLAELETRFYGLAGLKDKHLPAKVQYAITRNKKRLGEEIETMMIQRTDILEKRALRGKDEKPIINDETKQYEYGSAEDKEQTLRDCQELFDAQIDMDLMMVEMEQLERCDTEAFDTLTGNDMDALEFMIR